MSSSRTAPASPGDRFAIILFMAFAIVVLIGALVYGALVTAMTYDGKAGEFFFDVSYAAPGYPEVAADGTVTQTFGTISISSYEPLVLSRTLSSIATALPFLIVAVGCIGIIALSRRLLTARPFTRPARGVLTALGTVSAASAALVPWLRAWSEQAAVAQLGLPASGEDVANPDAEAWVVPGAFDPLQDLQWPLFVIGLALLLVSLLWRRAELMQRETEGLV